MSYQLILLGFSFWSSFFSRLLLFSSFPVKRASFDACYGHRTPYLLLPPPCVLLCVFMNMSRQEPAKFVALCSSFPRSPVRGYPWPAVSEQDTVIMPFGLPSWCPSFFFFFFFCRPSLPRDGERHKLDTNSEPYCAYVCDLRTTFSIVFCIVSLGYVFSFFFLFSFPLFCSVRSATKEPENVQAPGLSHVLSHLLL